MIVTIKIFTIYANQKQSNYKLYDVRLVLETHNGYVQKQTYKIYVDLLWPFEAWKCELKDWMDEKL